MLPQWQTKANFSAIDAARVKAAAEAMRKADFITTARFSQELELLPKLHPKPKRP
jgi:hypothetical protein